MCATNLFDQPPQPSLLWPAHESVPRTGTRKQRGRAYSNSSHPQVYFPSFLGEMPSSPGRAADNIFTCTLLKHRNPQIPNITLTQEDVDWSPFLQDSYDEFQPDGEVPWAIDYAGNGHYRRLRSRYPQYSAGGTQFNPKFSNIERRELNEVIRDSQVFIVPQSRYDFPPLSPSSSVPSLTSSLETGSTSSSLKSVMASLLSRRSVTNIISTKIIQPEMCIHDSEYRSLARCHLYRTKREDVEEQAPSTMVCSQHPAETHTPSTIATLIPCGKTRALSDLHLRDNRPSNTTSQQSSMVKDLVAPKGTPRGDPAAYYPTSTVSIGRRRMTEATADMSIRRTAMTNKETNKPKRIARSVVVESQTIEPSKMEPKKVQPKKTGTEMVKPKMVKPKETPSRQSWFTWSDSIPSYARMSSIRSGR